MTLSIRGCVVDEITGERLTSPDVRLYRTGVRGESCAVLDEHGCFSFPDLVAGEYSLGFQDSKYVRRYERLTLTEGDTLSSLQIALRPGGFLSGRILDEKQQPPQRCWFTLFRFGRRSEKTGYISDSGDHRVSADGTFCSPPLDAGRYFLRFAGIQHPATTGDPHEHHPMTKERLFDFLYPDAQDISEATGFEVKSGQTISGLRIQTQRAVWYKVRGKVTGDLPAEREHISVLFSRTMGTLDDTGGCGPPVEQDGTFQHELQSGEYSLKVCEFSPPEPDGRTRMLRTFVAANIRVAGADLSGIEIRIPS